VLLKGLALTNLDGPAINISTKDSKDALKCGGQLLIGGGDITLTVGGKGFKGLNAADVQPIGDGIDGNGNMTVSGGTIIVQGPPGLATGKPTGRL